MTQRRTRFLRYVPVAVGIVALWAGCAPRVRTARALAVPPPTRWCWSVVRLDTLPVDVARERIAAAFRRLHLGTPTRTDSMGVTRWSTPVVTRSVASGAARVQVVADLRADALGLRYAYEARRGPAGAAWTAKDSVAATALAAELCGVVGTLTP